jgi:hypothetical protein
MRGTPCTRFTRAPFVCPACTTLRAKCSELSGGRTVRRESFTNQRANRTLRGLRDGRHAGRCTF